MDCKLTLKMDKAIIEAAKRYAKDHQTSLSRLTESYLASLVDEKTVESDEIKFSPLVKKLSGVIELSPDFDYRKDLAEKLEKKYK